MRLLCPVILILLRTVNRLGYQLTMSDTIASQLIGHDLSRFMTMASQKPLEEALCSRTISTGLKIHIHHIAILIHCSPQIVPLAIDLNGPAHRRRLRR